MHAEADECCCVAAEFLCHEPVYIQCGATSRVLARARRLLRWLAGLVLLAALGWFGWLYFEINAVAEQDEARPADAIAVFGAAEYLGRPSPVLHARLDHAVELYREEIAPLVITLGGGAVADSGMTEGGVGRDYLLANGVPYERIIAETQSVDTEQQVARLAEIARDTEAEEHRGGERWDAPVSHPQAVRGCGADGVHIAAAGAGAYRRAGTWRSATSTRC